MSMRLPQEKLRINQIIEMFPSFDTIERGRRQVGGSLSTLINIYLQISVFVDEQIFRFQIPEMEDNIKTKKFNILTEAGPPIYLGELGDLMLIWKDLRALVGTLLI